MSEVDPEAVAACQVMLTRLGVETDPGAAARHVKALGELCHGRNVDPRRHLRVTFPPVSPNPGLIMVSEVPFRSVCAHHLLPFWGAAWVAYLPKVGGRIVGLSKLARVVQEYAARPQVQEALAVDILTALTTDLQCHGAAVRLRAVHTCMALRGASTGTGTTMVTTDYAGDLGSYREEFLTLVG